MGLFNLPLKSVSFQHIKLKLVQHFKCDHIENYIKLHRYVYQNNSYTIIHILYTVMCRTHQFNLFSMSTVELHNLLKLHAILH